MSALTSVDLCSQFIWEEKALFLNAESLSLAGVGHGRVAEATQSVMLTVVGAFVLFSLFCG